MRYLGRLFPLVILAIGTAIYWKKVVERSSEPPPPSIQKPTVVGLPPIKAGALSEERSARGTPFGEEVEAILEEADKLAEGDQKSLDALYQRFFTTIRRHENEYLRYFEIFIPETDRSPLRRSFLLVKGIIDLGAKGIVPLKAFLSQQPDSGPGPHRINLVKTFAMDRLVQRGESSDYKALLPTLLELAKNERDLAVARGALVTIARLGIAADLPALKKEVLRARRAEERDLFSNI